MINLERYIRDAKGFLDTQRVKRARADMTHARFTLRRRLGLFGERFDYAPQLQDILSFSAAYLDKRAEDVYAMIRYTDATSPLEFAFALTYILYTSEHLGTSYIDGIKIPKVFDKTKSRPLASAMHAALHSQFPVRVGAYKRDIDFILCVYGHELAIEIDGAAFHSDNAAIQRDLCCELALFEYRVPLIRITTSELQNYPFSLIHQAVCFSYERLPCEPRSPARPDEVLFHHRLTATQNTPKFIGYVAAALDYYFRCGVVSSIQTLDAHAVLDIPLMQRIFQKSANAKPAQQFILTFQAMQALITVTDTTIDIESGLHATQQSLITAFMIFFHCLKPDFRFELVNFSINNELPIPTGLLASQGTLKTASRIEHVLKKDFPRGNALIDVLNDMDTYNRKMLGLGEILERFEDDE